MLKIPRHIWKFFYNKISKLSSIPIEAKFHGLLGYFSTKKYRNSEETYIFKIQGLLDTYQPEISSFLKYAFWKNPNYS